MTKISYQSDCDLSFVEGKTLAVLGFSRFGRAMALNLRDGGYAVLVGDLPGATSTDAENNGFEVRSLDEAVSNADFLLLTFDYEVQGQLYHQHVSDHVRSGQFLMVTHGFSIHYGDLVPADQLDVGMVAPRSPSTTLRNVFEEGKSVPALIAVGQDATGTAWSRVRALGAAVGCAKAGLLESTFREEVEADLFGEQAVHAGGFLELLLTAYEVAVEAGYPPELAYFECIHEIKMIADLLYEGGFAHTHKVISPTASFGGLRAGRRVVDEHVRQSMRQILAEIRSGQFANEWKNERSAGFSTFRTMIEEHGAHPAEEVGKKLRESMYRND